MSKGAAGVRRPILDWQGEDVPPHQPSDKDDADGDRACSMKSLRFVQVAKAVDDLFKLVSHEISLSCLLWEIPSLCLRLQ